MDVLPVAGECLKLGGTVFVGINEVKLLERWNDLQRIQWTSRLKLPSSSR